MTTTIQVKTTTTSPPCIPGMAHYWELDSPNGKPTVKGLCHHCCATEEFPASGKDMDMVTEYSLEELSERGKKLAAGRLGATSSRTGRPKDRYLNY